MAVTDVERVFTLRAAKVSDAEAILEVLQAAFSEYRDRLDPPSGVHKHTVESIREKFETVEWVLAEQDRQAVGCVLYQPSQDYVYLGNLGVLPALRRVGIGGALIDYVEAHARELGIFRVRLAVRLVLTERRASYTRRGYTIIAYETHAGFENPTYVTMEKPLANVTS